ncbi:Ktr system potassium transporter B [Pasteurellaceae bacterium HPA106]|uniref:TrkH family potassium uptake protein n=1 Tax=Spirabiliibacterium pneumoniae TaxID=221400 RepID=UPI001AAD9B69|nr:TrkH family potassium uptake protein [Spirabiliibacterium pneumoniae]MBE2896868.1 Ktr system potassium transporter B [Spirabiliibacterium pneumoniae]
MKVYHSSTKPLRLLILGFFCFIFIGGCLLKLPFAYNGDLTWLSAFFTATSAVTVTGLAVTDTTHYTLFGQIVIMLLIQTGGLGFMTLAIAAMMSIGIRISSGSQQVAHEALGIVPMHLIGSTARLVIIFALLFEFIAVLILTWHWHSHIGLSRALYEAIFYAISAFNNAGFALNSDSLMPFVDDITVNFTITALIILGGLGFTVLIDITQNRRWSKFNLNTRLILITTLLLNIGAFLFFFFMETDNPNTLANAGLQEQLLASWFQAVTPRTAGFNSIDISQMTDASTMVMMFLMFIGGGSLSTASGIKIGTLVVLMVATLSYIKRKDSVTIFRYTISSEQIQRAIALFCISLSLILVSLIILLMIEHKHPFLDIVFEVVSALGTVGVSRGLTGDLTPLGQFVIMIMMFVGRLGPLTVAYVIALPVRSKVRYPAATIHIG